MTILVTAPTSTIGSIVVDELIARGAPLRLIARDPSRLSSSARAHAEVVGGSHGDPDVIGPACKGVEAVFWLPPNIEDAPSVDDSFSGFTTPACEAFVRHGVSHVVGISALGRGTPQADHAGQVTASLKMDDAIAATGVAYRAITCPSLMHNLLNHLGAIRDQGSFTMMIDPDLRAPMVAATDVATDAVRLLTDRIWHGHDEVPCLGPEDLSPNELAQIISEVIARPVRYVQISSEALESRLMTFGFSEPMARAMSEMFDAKNHGLDNAEPRTAASTTPTTFRQWCEEVLKPAFDSAGAP